MFHALRANINVLGIVLLSYLAHSIFTITLNPTWLVQPEMMRNRMLTIEIAS